MEVGAAVAVVVGVTGLCFVVWLRRGEQRLKSRLAVLSPLLPGTVRCVASCVESTPMTRLPLEASVVQKLCAIPRWIQEARACREGVEAAAHEDELFRALSDVDPGLAGDFVDELGELAAVDFLSRALRSQD